MNADTDFAASVSGGYSIKETGGYSTKESFSVTILQIIVATSDVNKPKFYYSTNIMNMQYLVVYLKQV